MASYAVAITKTTEEPDAEIETLVLVLEDSDPEHAVDRAKLYMQARFRSTRETLWFRFAAIDTRIINVLRHGRYDFDLWELKPQEPSHAR